MRGARSVLWAFLALTAVAVSSSLPPVSSGPRALDQSVSLLAVRSSSTLCGGQDLCTFYATKPLLANTPSITVVMVEDFSTTSPLLVTPGRVTAPLQQLLDVRPQLACGSFVTLGYLVVPHDQTDFTTLTPDFFLNSTLLAGSWFCTQPQSLQLTWQSGTTLPIAQFGQLAPQDNITMTVTLFFSNGASALVSATCTSQSTEGPLTTSLSSISTTEVGTTTAAMQHNSDMSEGWIAAAVVVPLIVLAGIVIVLIVFFRRRAQQQRPGLPGGNSNSRPRAGSTESQFIYTKQALDDGGGGAGGGDGEQVYDYF